MAGDSMSVDENSGNRRDDESPSCHRQGFGLPGVAATDGTARTPGRFATVMGRIFGGHSDLGWRYWAV